MRCFFIGRHCTYCTKGSRQEAAGAHHPVTAPAMVTTPKPSMNWLVHRSPKKWYTCIHCRGVMAVTAATASAAVLLLPAAAVEFTPLLLPPPDKANGIESPVVLVTNELRVEVVIPELLCKYASTMSQYNDCTPR